MLSKTSPSRRHLTPVGRNLLILLLLVVMTPAGAIAQAGMAGDPAGDAEAPPPSRPSMAPT